MSDIQGSKVYVLEQRTRALERMALRQQWLVLAALLVASALVPLTVTADDGGSDGGDRHSRGLFGSLAYFFGSDAEDFGSKRTHPHSLLAGFAVNNIGLVLILVGLVAAVIGALMLLDDVGRAGAALIVAAGIVLLAGSLGVVLGQLWLPDGDELATRVSGGIAVPVIAACWLFYALRTSRALR